MTPHIPGYQIEAVIGAGSMGTVYRAVQLALGRTVALKVLHPSCAGDPGLLARFEREAKLVASLSHQNIVSVLDYGMSGETPYIAMQLVSGVTLERFLVGRPLPASDVVRIMRQVALALDYAHSQGVIHRDIKPANILIQQDGHVLLADFGVAKSLAATGLTNLGVSMGTPTYMAPEVCMRQPAQAASDIYSFGILLYEMLVGRKPFSGADAMSIMHQHINDQLAWPAGSLPNNMVAAIQAATQKNPTDRPKMALQVINAASVADPQPVMPQQLVSHSASHPTRIPLLVALTLLGLGGSAMIAIAMSDGGGGGSGNSTLPAQTPIVDESETGMDMDEPIVDTNPEESHSNTTDITPKIANILDYGRFTIEVPSDWSVELSTNAKNGEDYWDFASGNQHHRLRIVRSNPPLASMFKGWLSLSNSYQGKLSYSLVELSESSSRYVQGIGQVQGISHEFRRIHIFDSGERAYMHQNRFCFEWKGNLYTVSARAPDLNSEEPLTKELLRLADSLEMK